MLFIRLIILSIFSCICQCQFSAPLIPKQSSYFQSGLVQLSRLSPISTWYTYPITYKNSKTISPLVLFSYGGVDYNLNKLYSGNSSVLLSIYLYTSSNSLTEFTAVAVVANSIQMNSIKYTYLAIDTSFPYMNAIDAAFLSYTGINSYASINYMYSNPIFATFLWGLNHQFRMPTNPQQVGLYFQQSQYNSTCKWFILRSSSVNYYFMQTRVIILTIYLSKLPADLFQAIPLTLETLSQTSKIITPGYSYLISTIFYGLTAFSINAIPYNTSKSFNFNFTLSQSGQFQLQNSLALTKVTINLIVLHAVQCPKNFPFMRLNTLSSIYECYDYCLSGQFHFYDIVLLKYICQPCVTPCIECFSTTQCKTCPYYMDLTQVGQCVQKNTYAIVATVVNLCSYSIGSCITCSLDGSTCTSCMARYALSLSGLTCTACSLININCQSCTPTECLTCTTGYVLQNPTLCVVYVQPIPPIVIICTASNCSKCQPTNVSQCYQCFDQQLTIVNGVCSFKCGDGKVMGLQQCDDGNMLNLDGCSSECLIEDDFQCTSLTLFNSTSKYNTSTCLYSKYVTFQVRKILKLPNQNKVRIYVYLSTIKSSIWSGVDFAKIFTLSGTAILNVMSTKITNPSIFRASSKSSFPRLLQGTSQISEDDMIVIEIEYNQTIQKQPLTLMISPISSGLQALSQSQPYEHTFDIVSQNNQLVNYYPQSEYQNARILSVIALGLGFGMFALIIVGSFAGNMLITMEMATILQLSYLSLLTVGELNPYFYALSGLKYSSGYNIPLSTSASTPSNKLITGIGLSPSIVNNISISLLLILLPLLIGGILRLLTKFVIKKQELKQTLSQISDDCLGSLPFYLLNCFTPLIGASIVINFAYKSTQGLGYVMIAISVILLVGYVGIFSKFNQSRYFTRITQKVHNFKVLYLLLSLAIKLVLSILIAFFCRSIACSLIIAILYLLYSLVLVIKLIPYKNAHKIRLTLNNFMMVMIFCIFSYHQFSTSSSQQRDINLYIPCSIAALLGLIFAINASFWIYSIKKLRCCELQIEWEKIKQTNKMLLTVESNNEEKYASKSIHRDHQQSNKCMILANQMTLEAEEMQQNSQICKISPQKTNQEQKYKTKIYIQQLQKQHIDQNPISNPKHPNSPLNRQLLQQQIKKHLKSSSIIPIPHKISIPHKKLSSSLNQPQINTDSIYETYKKSNADKCFKMLGQDRSTPKYKYTQNEKYCLYDEFNNI